MAVSILPKTILKKTVLGIENKVIPRVVTLLKVLFLRELTISPFSLVALDGVFFPDGGSEMGFSI